MIVVDSSAVIAIFRQQQDAGDFARRIVCKGNDFPSTDIGIA